MMLFLGIAGLMAVAISETMGDPEDSLPTTVPALTSDTVCPGQRHFYISDKHCRICNTKTGKFSEIIDSFINPKSHL
jgi:hypothetical protein